MFSVNPSLQHVQLYAPHDIACHHTITLHLILIYINHITSHLTITSLHTTHHTHTTTYTQIGSEPQRRFQDTSAVATAWQRRVLCLQQHPRDIAARAGAQRDWCTQRCVLHNAGQALGRGTVHYLTVYCSLLHYTTWQCCLHKVLRCCICLPACLPACLSACL